MEQDQEEIRLVVDTNILISALLKDDSLTGRLLRSNSCNFYYPCDGLAEIECYRDYIVAKRAKSQQIRSFEYAMEFVLESVDVVPSELYSSRMREAFDIMKDVDPKDTPFLALALQIGIPLWSNDKHFMNQSLVPVYSTQSLIGFMSDRGIWW